MRKKRIFNIRPVCFFAFFLTVGIILGEALSALSPMYRLIPIFAFLFGIVYFLILRKTRRFTYCWIAALIGLLGISGTYDILKSVQIDTCECVVEARVASEIVVNDNGTNFIIDNIFVNGQKVSGKSEVTIPFEIEPTFRAGDVINMHGRLTAEKHEPFNTYFASSVAKGILYRFKTKSVVKIADGEPPFPLNLQLEIKKLFYENLDDYSSSICQALVLGDKSGLDKSLYNDIKSTGLAHLFAVSGLHITVVAGALYWLLKKLKVNRKAAFVVVTVLTFLYVMLCSFTPSALRAFIMTAVFTFASASGYKRDNLSALALAACLILIFRPISLMEVGFLLSMFAMLGIFLFYKPINDFFMRGVNKLSPKRKIGKKSAGIVSLSLATNLATYPMTAHFFQAVPVLFIVSNLIILPYMMFTYMVLLVITAFSLITTLSGAVGIMYYLLFPFKIFISAVGSISFASVPAAMSYAGIIAYSLCMPLVSRYVFLTKKQKIQGVLSVLAVALALSAPLALL